MNLIETYSLNTGLKIEKPYMYEKYFPIPFDKYILIHAGGGMPSKFYDYYNEVIELLKPLREQGYELIQIGGEGDSDLHSIIDLSGKSDIHQTAFLVKRAKLLIGNDSCLAHLAAALNTPVVALYGPTTPQNHGPYFGELEKKILIESHRKGEKPSFSKEESPKTINFIKPEEVAKAAFKLLDIKENITRESLFIGKEYGAFKMDVIMDTIVAPESFQGAFLDARMDLEFNEEKLAANLQIRPFAITTNKPINLNLLKGFKKNVMGVCYEVEKDSDPSFIKSLLNSGIQYNIFTQLKQEDIGDLKLKFFDYGLIHTREKMSKEKIENHEKMTKYTLYKTTKFLLGRNKIYLNKIDWQDDKSVPLLENNVAKIHIDNPEFFNEAESYYIYNEKENKN